jgi:tetratricopeptide (TPR) repeat protein
MKNILILILALCATIASEAATTKTRPSETAKLSEKVDSLTSVIDGLSHNIQTITKTQEMLSIRMAETREDYMTFLTDSHETRNWTIGIISLIVAALGVAAPLLLSYLAKQKSETLFRTLKQDINSIAEQINRDREIINTQLSDIRTIKDQIDKIQAKIKASENNARESQQRAMISSLFSQALKEEDKNTVIKLYSRILKIDPKYADALNNRSIAYADLEQYDKALADALQYISIRPDSPNGYAIAGYIYLQKQDYSEAIRYCHEAISRDPQDIRGYQTLSLVYLKCSQWQDFIDLLNTIAQKTQLTSGDYNNRAYAYYKLNKLEIALADVNESLAMDETKASTYDTRACIYMGMGADYYDLSLNDLNKAISLDPSLWDAYENRAALYQKMIENTSDPEQKEHYKQLRLADLETFRKQSTCKANESDDTK